MCRAVLALALLLTPIAAHASTVFGNTVASFTGSITKTSNTITGGTGGVSTQILTLSAGTPLAGAAITCSGCTSGAYILAVYNIGGTYSAKMSVPSTITNGTTITQTQDLLSITAISLGTIIAGQEVYGTSVAADTIPLGLLSGGNGDGITCSTAPCSFFLNNTQSSVGSEAMTTTDCSSSITITNAGLTVQGNVGAANGYYACRANNPKYILNGGLYYYEFSYTGTASSNYHTVGLASPATVNGEGGGSQPLLANPSSFQMGFEATSIGYYALADSAETFWNSGHTTAGTNQVSGKTGAIVVNFNSDPMQVWVTPDIATLSCNGSGSSGSTNPQWNNSCADDPSLAGSGHPNNGTGHISTGPFILGYTVYPAFAVQVSNSHALNPFTFNFARDATLESLLPAGYANGNWDHATDTPPVSTVTKTIANAPLYSNGATMTAGNASVETPASRILGGPGCAKAGFTNGSNCWLWQASNSGTLGTGDTSSWACPTPANTGGIYATSFPGASTETDNGVTFACLTNVNYSNITSAQCYEPTSFVTSNAYFYNQYVNISGRCYKMTTSESSAPYTCTAGATAPTGTAFGTGYSDGTCQWTYQGTVQFENDSSPVLHQVHWQGISQSPTMAYANHVVWQIWYGGLNRESYTAGLNGETDPMFLAVDRYSIISENANALCYLGTGAGISNIVSAQYDSCLGELAAFIQIIQPAPGDSFLSNRNPATDPLRFDASKGVNWVSNDNYALPGSPYASAGEPVYFFDNGAVINGIEILSPGVAVWGDINTSDIQLSYDLIDSGNSGASGGPAAVMLDGGSECANSVIVSRSTVSGAFGIRTHYAGPIDNCTFVGVSATNGTAIGMQSPAAGSWYDNGQNYPPPFFGNYFTGFQREFAYVAVDGTPTLFGGWNATTLSSDPGGTFTGADGLTYTSEAMPGVTNGLATGQLVNETPGASFDGRVASTSVSIYEASSIFAYPALGQPGNLSTWSTGPQLYGTPQLFPSGFSAAVQNGTDIFGTSRLSRTPDIGAEMFVAAPPPTITGPGRMFRAENDNQLFRMLMKQSD